MRTSRLAECVVVLSLASIAVPARAHLEREIASPVRPGPVPDINRVNPNRSFLAALLDPMGVLILLWRR